MKVTKTYSSAAGDAIDDTKPIFDKVLGAPASIPNCEVSDLPDGSVIITLHVESHIMKRHRLRAGTMQIERYMWENILNRALVDSVY